MRLFVLGLAGAAMSASMAFAVPVTASAVGPIMLVPSADVFSLNALSTTSGVPGIFTQTGSLIVGDSTAPETVNIPFSFNDTFTINGITETLTFTGDLDVTPDLDTLTIGALNNIAFGNLDVSFSQVSLLADAETTYPVTLNGSISATPEPSSIALLGTGVLGLAGFVRKRFA